MTQANMSVVGTYPGSQQSKIGKRKCGAKAREAESGSGLHHEEHELPMLGWRALEFCEEENPRGHGLHASSGMTVLPLR